MSEFIARTLRVRGLVQGVFYRASAAAEARRMGLAGWVRNRRDGSVEILVAGDSSAVGAFIGWSRKGPSTARVEQVEVLSTQLPERADFQILDSV